MFSVSSLSSSPGDKDDPAAVQQLGREHGQREMRLDAARGGQAGCVGHRVEHEISRPSQFLSTREAIAVEWTVVNNALEHWVDPQGGELDSQFCRRYETKRKLF